MKSNSTVSPSKVILSNEKIYIVDIDSIVGIATDDLENPQASYTYEMYELPIAHRENLNEYIEANYQVSLDFAKAYAHNLAIKPSDAEVVKAEQENNTINLLIDLGVL